MNKFFEYDTEEESWYHIKARDMSIYKPDGKVITFWLWGNSESYIRQILSKKDIKDIEWIKKDTPPFV
jgi:hypothetical protein